MFLTLITYTNNQKTQIDSYINTSRFVYNKTLDSIKKGDKPNFQNLRDKLVTKDTKKGYDAYKRFDILIQDLKAKERTEDIEHQIKDLQQQRRNEVKNLSYVKNPLIHDFEVETHKDIRANAVHECCTAVKSGISNLKKGNIKFFNLKFKKKTQRKQTIELTPGLIKIKNNSIYISALEDKKLVVDKRNNRKLKNLKIDHNVDLSKIDNEYYLHIPVKTTKKQETKPITTCGIDLGVRTFGTVYQSNNSITEYNFKNDLIIKINNKIDILKNRRLHTRKKAIKKREARKRHLIDKCHWDIANDIIKNNDLILLGDIKSHDIVKGNKNHYLNRIMNDLKLYTFKERLTYKAALAGKKVVKVHEAYTTKTCCNCGFINNHVGSKSVYTCPTCNMVTGRDINASKNMLIKGLIV